MSKKKVLVIDNYQALLKIYAAMMEKAGFYVATDATGDDAMSVTKKNNPDVIILDVLLPRRTVWEILAELKKDDATKNIPVIMVSNIGSTSREIEAKDAGAEAYMVKAEISLQKLIDKIDEVTDKKSKS